LDVNLIALIFAGSRHPSYSTKIFLGGVPWDINEDSLMQVRDGQKLAVLRIRIHRIHMFLGLPDPDPLVRGIDPDPDPDPSIIMQK
jgi:hypothetical protein